MKTRMESGGRWIVSLERGDMLRACIEGLASQQGIGCAELTAIGAVADPELGFYDLAAKRYDRRVFEGDWELVSLMGNITLKDDKPFLHAHVAIGGRDFTVRGGHLFDCRVAAVVEMFLTPMVPALRRLPCDDIGLHCWEP